MKTEIKIQVPNPCTQPWEEMAPEAGGRHCTACSQTVTDFRHMTDAQILETLKNTVGGCGRYRADQLNRVLVTPPAKRRFSFASFYKIAASLLFVLSAGEASATEKPSFTQEPAPNNAPWSSIIEGIVSDAKGRPLTGVFVKITETTSGALINSTLTDMDGSYRLRILGYVAVENVHLSFSYTGYVANMVEQVILVTEQTTVVNTVLVPFSKQDSLLLWQGRVPATTHVYSKPLINAVVPRSQTLTPKEIEKMGMRDISAQVATQPGVNNSGRGTGLSIGGGRGENTVYIIDGVLQTGNTSTSKPKKWWQFWKHRTPNK